MRKSWVASVVAAAAALGTAGAAAPVSAAPSPGGCVQVANGFASIAAGSPTSARAFTAHGTSDDYACHTSDPTIHSAHEVWRESGTFQCVPQVLDAKGTGGTDTFTWDNGRTSVMKLTDYSFGAIDYIDANFVSGEFAGEHVGFTGTGVSPFTDNVTGLVGFGKACSLGQEVNEVPSGYSGVLVLPG